MYDQPLFLQTLSRFAVVLPARYDLEEALSELTESVTAVLGLSGLPQFVGIFGVSRVRFAWSGAWSGRSSAKSCRHTTCGVSLDTGHDVVILCRHVPARNAADEPGRVGGVLPAARTQRTAPEHGDPCGEGDPQLWPGRQRGPRRSGPVGVLDLPVPDPGAGRRRGPGRRGGGPGLPPHGWGLDAGPPLG